MPESKRHHYVPQFILRKHTNPAGYLHVYDRVSRKDLPACRPHALGFEKHLYAFGKNNEHSLEPQIAEGDDFSAQLLRKVEDSGIVKLEELHGIQDILAFQTTRVPGFVNDVADIESKFMKIFMDMKLGDKERARVEYARLFTPGMMPFDEFFDGYKKFGDSMVIEVSQTRKMQIMAEQTEGLTRRLRSYGKLTIVTPKEKKFIASDCIVFSFNRNSDSYGKGASMVGMRNTSVYFPFSAGKMLVLEHGENKVYSANMEPENVLGLNSIVAKLSDRITFGCDPELVGIAVRDSGIKSGENKPRLSIY